MTDCALDTTTRRPRAVARPAPRRSRPDGIPWWVALLGVVVFPLSRGRRDADESQGDQAWVVSAGSGTAYVAAVFVDEATRSTSPRSGERFSS